jgi:hypothetical protein
MLGIFLFTLALMTEVGWAIAKVYGTLWRHGTAGTLSRECSRSMLNTSRKHSASSCTRHMPSLSMAFSFMTPRARRAATRVWRGQARSTHTDMWAVRRGSYQSAAPSCDRLSRCNVEAACHVLSGVIQLIPMSPGWPTLASLAVRSPSCKPNHVGLGRCHVTRDTTEWRKHIEKISYREYNCRISCGGSNGRYTHHLR